MPGGETVSTATGMLHSPSMGGVSMTLSNSTPCIGLPSGSTQNHTSSVPAKTKASRSSSHPSTNGGPRKRTSPTPATGGNSAKKSQQFVLVAAEAIPLKDAGTYVHVCVSKVLLRDCIVNVLLWHETSK